MYGILSSSDSDEDEASSIKKQKKFGEYLQATNGNGATCWDRRVNRFVINTVKEISNESLSSPRNE